MQPPVHSDGGTVQHGGQVGKGASRIAPCTMRGPYIELIPPMSPRCSVTPSYHPSIPKLRASAMRREGADRLESVHRDAPKVEQLPSVREHAKHSYAGSFAISSWMGNNTAEKMDPNTADPSVQS